MEIEELAGALRTAERVLVLTGAGISASSGLPTYRQQGSAWSDPQLEAMSHATRYGNHLPALWQFWGALRSAATAADPNPAHHALAAAQRRCAASGGALTVVTQNIDGLHQRAGSTDVVELHGSIHRTRCLRRRCGVPHLDRRLPEPGYALPCASCGGRARPDVVLFGERLPTNGWKQALDAAKQAQVCLFIGTSGTVWPAASLLEAASQNGALCALVNADQWAEPHPAFAATVLGDAATTLPALLG